MKQAWLIALGALGLLGLLNYQKARAKAGMAEQLIEPIRRPLASKRRFRHRSEDGLLDLNSATVFELKDLTGIGDALANRIIENRPYLTKIDLVGRRVIPDGTYNQIKHSVTVRRAA
jgi:DNA uptake protein ComE-like DNA-binding protein